MTTGKLAEVRTAIGGTEENKGDGRPFFFFLYQESRGESEVIDSSLHVTILFPVFPHKHSYLRSE